MPKVLQLLRDKDIHDYHVGMNTLTQTDLGCPLEVEACYIIMAQTPHDLANLLEAIKKSVALKDPHPHINDYILDKKSAKKYAVAVPPKAGPSKLSSKRPTTKEGATAGEAGEHSNIDKMVARAKKRRLLPEDWSWPSTPPKAIAKLSRAPTEREQLAGFVLLTAAGTNRSEPLLLDATRLPAAPLTSPTPRTLFVSPKSNILVLSSGHLRRLLPAEILAAKGWPVHSGPNLEFHPSPLEVAAKSPVAAGWLAVMGALQIACQKEAQ